MIRRRHARWALWAVLAALVAFSVAWWAGWLDPLMERLNPEAVQALVDRAGLWGPVLIIGLMAAAVVASPIPSAPIAVAAGAAYGDLWGTIYTVAGAELGAVVAFCLARLLGREVLLRWFGEKVDAGLLGSQNALMLAVFVSRLIPFVSFDMMSYAAGLSCLAPWRFALATLAGIVPVAFFLVHVGDSAARGDLARAAFWGVAFGFVTVVPLAWVAWRDWRRGPPEDGA